MKKIASAGLFFLIICLSTLSFSAPVEFYDSFTDNTFTNNWAPTSPFASPEQYWNQSNGEIVGSAAILPYSSDPPSERPYGVALEYTEGVVSP